MPCVVFVFPCPVRKDALRAASDITANIALLIFLLFILLLHREQAMTVGVPPVQSSGTSTWFSETGTTAAPQWRRVSGWNVSCKGAFLNESAVVWIDYSVRSLATGFQNSFCRTSRVDNPAKFSCNSDWQTNTDLSGVIRTVQVSLLLSGSSVISSRTPFF